MSRTSAIADSPVSATPKHYTWSFPGSPVKVQLALSVVEQLEKELRHIENASGLLLGGFAGHTTDVRGFKPVTDSSQPSKVGAVASDAVGYYRITRDPALRLNPADIKLAEALFPDPHQVFLLIQHSESGSANATFFFWDEGQMCGDFPFLEFPFDAAALAVAEQNRVETIQKKLAVVAEASESTSLAGLPPAVNRIGKVVFWGFLTMLAISLLVVAMVVIKRLPGKNQPLRSAPVSASPAALPAQGNLGLQAERHNGDLKVTWNREAPSISNATSGVLSIEDGGARRNITLASIQVRSGSILYAPTGDQVQMQLTVLSAQGSTSESVIVILPKSGSPQLQPVVHKLAPAAPRAQARLSVTQEQPPAKLLTSPGKPFTSPANPEKVQPSVPSLQLPPSSSSRTDSMAAMLPPVISGLASVPSPPPANTRPAPAAPATIQKPVMTVPENNPASGQPPAQRQEQAAQPPEPVVRKQEQAVYSPPVVSAKVMATFPPSLRAVVSKPKTVSVKVGIDERGKVTSAEAVPSGEWVPQLMTATAVSAARLWKFEPARKGAQAIPGEMVLKFVFNPSQ